MLTVMTAEQHDASAPAPQPAAITGEVGRIPAPPWIRALLAATGLTLLVGLARIVTRYLLALRAQGSARLDRGSVVIDVERTLLGKRIRRERVVLPRTSAGARLESRQRFVALLVGFSSFVVGALVGLHLFVDGLRAGYPYLMLVGAAVVAVGAAVELTLYLLFPRGHERSRLHLSGGGWIYRFSGVDTAAALGFISSIAPERSQRDTG